MCSRIATADVDAPIYQPNDSRNLEDVPYAVAKLGHAVGGSHGGDQFMCHVCVEEASQRASQGSQATGSQATEVGGVRLTARSAVAKSTTVGSAARHSAPSRGGRPRCKCRCGCQHRPGRRTNVLAVTIMLGQDAAGAKSLSYDICVCNK